MEDAKRGCCRKIDRDKDNKKREKEREVGKKRSFLGFSCVPVNHIAVIVRRFIVKRRLPRKEKLRSSALRHVLLRIMPYASRRDIHGDPARPRPEKRSL